MALPLPQIISTKYRGLPHQAARNTLHGFTSKTKRNSNEEPRPSRRVLLTIQAALDPSPARPGAAHIANWCAWRFIGSPHSTRRATDGSLLTPPPCQVGNSREIRHPGGKGASPQRHWMTTRELPEGVRVFPSTPPSVEGSTGERSPLGHGGLRGAARKLPPPRAPHRARGQASPSRVACHRRSTAAAVHG